MAKTIAQIVRARADELELSAYAIARMAMVNGEFTVSVYHINEYLAGRKDMTTGKLDHICHALGLELGVRQHESKAKRRRSRVKSDGDVF